MPITHTTRTGKTYYLHTGKTKTGKPKFFCSRNKSGELADAIPEGFEIYEDIDGKAFLRRIPEKIILPDESAMVQDALLRHGEAWQFKAEVKNDTIIIYECGSNLNELEEMVGIFGVRRLTAADKARFASYTAVLRFVLTDKQARLFATERYCFRGSVDDWIPIAAPCELQVQIKRYIKHVGRESIYDLY
jgi:hypothetical protein